MRHSVAIRNTLGRTVVETSELKSPISMILKFRDFWQPEQFSGIAVEPFKNNEITFSQWTYDDKILPNTGMKNGRAHASYVNTGIWYQDSLSSGR